MINSILSIELLDIGCVSYDVAPSLWGWGREGVERRALLHTPIYFHSWSMICNVWRYAPLVTIPVADFDTLHIE